MAAIPPRGSTAAILALFLLARPAAGQRDTLIRTSPAASPDSAAAIQQLPVARPAPGAIRLDGRLDEPEWSVADSIIGFRQPEPAEGAPASEPTVVRLLRGTDALYVGVRAFDRDPRAVRATQLRRDADLEVDDNVTLIIDSYHDRRGAFLFRTNPNGAMWDAQLTGFEDVNEDWNGIWEVAAQRDSAGWTAEFRIPWRTLRFRPGGTAIGFNVQRFVRRNNEETLWRSWGTDPGAHQPAVRGGSRGLRRGVAGARGGAEPLRAGARDRGIARGYGRTAGACGRGCEGRARRETRRVTNADRGPDPEHRLRAGRG